MTVGLAAHDTGRTHLASDGSFGVLWLVDQGDVEERSLGFSLADGAALWQRTEPVTAPHEGMLLDRGQSISVRASEPGREVRVHDLRTGALQFTRGSQLPRRMPWHEAVLVGELLALPDDSRGLVLLRRDNGSPRTNLPFSGDAEQPPRIAGGRLWLVGDRADGAAAMLRVLDLRTLQPVGAPPSRSSIVPARPRPPGCRHDSLRSSCRGTSGRTSGRRRRHTPSSLRRHGRSICPRPQHEALVSPVASSCWPGARAAPSRPFSSATTSTPRARFGASPTWSARSRTPVR